MKNADADSSAATPNVAVVGAGPGGLTLARILQQRGARVTVYEREADAHARDQGGSLDLRADDGQRALTEAGLIDRFRALARPEGEEMRQFDPATGATTFHHIPEPGDHDKPEIDRTQLRQLLLDSLAPGTVSWSSRVTAVESEAGNEHDSEPGHGRMVRLADGRAIRHDLVVGADGTFSRVRRSLSTAEPEYSGVTFVEAWFDDVARRHPWLDAFCGGGAAAGADGSRGLFAQRNSDDHVRVYIMLKVPVDWMGDRGLDAEDTDSFRSVLLKEFAGWHPDLTRMISDTDGRYVPRQIWSLPVVHHWEHSPSLTLIGDAAHVMPPVGVGVNLAMLDACELALALTTRATVDEAIRTYEQAMWSRSAEYAEQARAMFDMLLQGAPPPSSNQHDD